MDIIIGYNMNGRPMYAQDAYDRELVEGVLSLYDAGWRAVDAETLVDNYTDIIEFAVVISLLAMLENQIEKGDPPF